MNLSRRDILAGSAALPLLATALQAAAQTPTKSKLVMLGTGGGPNVGAPRHQTSHVIVCGEDAYVVDCGYGVTEQMVKAGVPSQNIRDIFITHHHPDHDIEMGTLIYFAWYNGLAKPLGLYGGPPLRQITDNYLAAQKPDVDIWVKDVNHTPMPPIQVHEITAGGPVMTDKNVRVTAALVDHPPVVPAFAYRFDMADRSIVFSGDTSPLAAVAQLAKGADILVHEAMYTPGLKALVGARQASGPGAAVDAAKLMEHLVKSHSPVEEVGRIAQEAGVKTLVLSHLVPSSGVADDIWIQGAAKTFKGEIIVARDLMVL